MGRRWRNCPAEMLFLFEIFHSCTKKERLTSSSSCPSSRNAGAVPNAKDFAVLVVPQGLLVDIQVASGINQIDASGADALAEWHENYQARGVTLLIANLKGPVRDVLARTPLYESLGKGLDRFTIEDAVARGTQPSQPSSRTS